MPGHRTWIEMHPNELKSCKFCGKGFIPKQNGARINHCSDICYIEDRKKKHRESARRNCKNWKNYGLHNEERFEEDKIIDNDITWKTVLEKQGRNCGLCGLEVNTKDFYINENGWFVMGNTYPTVDHITPRSIGGFHSWDNVRLAHNICNRMKSNKYIG